MSRTDDLLNKILENQKNNQLRFDRIESQQKKTSEDLAQHAMNLSTYMNKQNIHNANLRRYLYNDDDTGQEGLIKQVANLNEKVTKFDKKLAVFTVCAVAIVTGLKYLLGKLLVVGKFLG